MSGALAVLISGRRAGTLKWGARPHEPSFSYDEQYADAHDAVPLSASLPLSRIDHTDTAKIANWLQGLLPDNDDTLERWRRLHDVSNKTAVGLLSTPVGLDCPGAVQFSAPGDVGGVTGREGGIHWMTTNETERLCHHLDRGGPDAPEPVGRYSLAGAQRKAAVVIADDGRWGAPFGGTPSTHIVKPSMSHPDLPDQAINEHLCLEAARRLGLLAAASSVERVGGVLMLLVTRYDRINTPGGILRVHQEDLCQAFGIHPDHKYQSERGPSPEAIADLLWVDSADPEHDVRRFCEALVLNWLLAGTDAHAKNYSLIYDTARPILAPLYDISSWLPYHQRGEPLAKVKLAMKTGRDYTLAKSDDKRAWQRTGKALGLDGDETVARAEAMATALPDALSAAAAGLPGEFAASQTAVRLVERGTQRANRLRSLPEVVIGTKQGRSRQPAPAGWTVQAEQAKAEPPPAQPCSKTVKSTGEGCVLRSGHDGRCRSKLKR